MRKVILNIACSLDGYIAGPRGEIDWLFTGSNPAFLETIDLILMGRKSYDVLRLSGAWPYVGTQAHVFSRALQNASHDHVMWISEDLKGHVKSLKKANGKDIWLLGGGEIIRTCLSHQLIDEIILSIHPVLLGKGIPLFPATFPLASCTLQKSESFPSGLVQLSYQVI